MVRFDNVGMRYGRGPEVLRDISFHLKPGSFHFLTGTSGAGKTSLLRLLFLANRPSRGLVTMFDHDIATTPHATLPDLRRKIGVVFQDFRLLEHLSALENVALPLRITGAEEDGIEENVTELLIWVGLKDRLHAKPSSLSGGEQQRVAIARALIARPDLFLADEPTGNVDPEMGQRLMHLFQELNKLGTTTVIATHDLRLMERNDFARLHLDRGMLNYIPGETGLARNLDVPHAGPGHLPTSAFDV